MGYPRHARNRFAPVQAICNRTACRRIHDRPFQTSGRVDSLVHLPRAIWRAAPVKHGRAKRVRVRRTPNLDIAQFRPAGGYPAANVRCHDAGAQDERATPTSPVNDVRRSLAPDRVPCRSAPRCEGVNAHLRPPKVCVPASPGVSQGGNMREPRRESLERTAGTAFWGDAAGLEPCSGLAGPGRAHDRWRAPIPKRRWRAAARWRARHGGLAIQRLPKYCLHAHTTGACHASKRAIGASRPPKPWMDAAGAAGRGLGGWGSRAPSGQDAAHARLRRARTNASCASTMRAQEGDMRAQPRFPRI